MELSACVNASKIDFCFPAGIPGPVSCTAKCSRTLFSVSSSRSTRTTTSPSEVNLMAFPTRLTTIWRRRVGSPTRRSGTSGRIWQASSRRFWWARPLSVFMVVSRESRRPKSIASRSSLPASILEKSRMSFSRESKESAEAFAVVRYSRCSCVSSVSSASSVMPMTPFIGVRISWLMLARNSPFAWLAASAASLAFRDSSSAPLRISISNSRL